MNSASFRDNSSRNISARAFAAPPGSTLSRTSHRRSPRHRGFSLVLSLVIMGMLVVLVACLVSFLGIEMQLTTLSVDRQRARLNATAALHLAVAQLQQEAGPDQRATAQANVTIPVSFSGNNHEKGVANALRREWVGNGRNPYWTGVWDTRVDYADIRPPAWLVSGEDQMKSLEPSSGVSAGYASLPKYASPWKKVSDKDNYVTLFSPLSDDVLKRTDKDTGVFEHPFDTRVTVPKLDIRDHTGNITGHYAWWTGDEGVKARLNLPEQNDNERYPGAAALSRLTAQGRGPVELLPGWEKIPVESKDAAHVLDTAAYANIKELANDPGAITGGAMTSITNTYAHAVTAYSQGILTDVRDGGLKQDLTYVFEMSYAEFLKSPFGNTKDTNGTVTLNMPYPEGGNGGPGHRRTWKWEESLEPMKTIAECGVWRARPIYNVVLPGGNLRGPAWELLRDYYRMYRAVLEMPGGDNLPKWSNYITEEANSHLEKSRVLEQGADGVLRARTFYPTQNYISDSADQATPSLGGFYESGGDNKLISEGGMELKSGVKVNAALRPLRVAFPAYISRYTYAVGMQRDKNNKLIFVMMPFNVVRNPFNVPIRIGGRDLTIRGGATGNSALFSAQYGNFRQEGYNSLESPPLPKFAVTVDGRVGADGKPDSRPYLIKLAGLIDANTTVNDVENKGWGLGWHTPEVTIPPGESWIFSVKDLEFTERAKDVFLQRGVNLRGGWIFRKLPRNDGNPVDEGIVIPSGENSTGLFTIEFDYDKNSNEYWYDLTWVMNQMNSYQKDEPKDRLSSHPWYAPNGALHSNLRVMLLDDSIIGKVNKMTYDITAIPYDYTGTVAPLFVSEFVEKPANWSKSTVEGLWPGTKIGKDNGYPVYAMSNPLASSLSPAAQTMWKTPTGSTQFTGFQSSSPSYQFSFREAGDLESLIEGLHHQAYAGGGITALDGQRKFISAYIPRSPLVSLGEFQTANFTVADHQALYSVGHSFPTPFVKPNGVFRNYQNWQNHDNTWLSNNALWDRFFFSTIAPETDGYTHMRKTPGILRGRDQKGVWKDFKEGKKPLLNQTFVLNRKANSQLLDKILTGNDSVGDKDGYLKTAGLLYQNGTFNINSTDHRAWRAILGGNKGVQIPWADNDGKNIKPKPIGGPNDNRTPFPRAVPLIGADNDEPEFAYKNKMDTPGSWKSAKALDPGQLAKLAQALVNKIFFRWSGTNEAKYQGMDGVQTICRPFFSLSEFVNRALVDDGATAGNGTLGVIQAAIYHADRHFKAEINTGMKQDGKDINDRKLSGSFGNRTSGDGFPSPESLRHPDGDFLLSSGAFGTLLQGDILQTIGAKISARSDTFVVRAYGDVGGGAGTRSTARAYLEAVVQRTPEYVDDSTKSGNVPHDPAPHSRVKTGDDGVDFSRSGKLAPVNFHLGRRFRIVSLRWLSEPEL